MDHPQHHISAALSMSLAACDETVASKYAGVPTKLSRNGRSNRARAGSGRLGAVHLLVMAQNLFETDRELRMSDGRIK